MKIKNFLIPEAGHQGISPFHFVLGAKKRNFIFCPTRNCKKKQFRPPPRRGNIGNIGAEPSRNYLD